MDLSISGSDLDGSQIVHLLRRLRLQGSTRIECNNSITESYPIQTPGQEIQPELRSMRFHKHQLVEIFAVVLLENAESCSLEADVVVRTENKDYVLWNNINGRVNSEGDLILTGPNCDCRDPELVYFQSNYVTTTSGIIEVRFAVYGDGVEIRLEAALLDLNLESLRDVVCPLRVYGSVQASNHFITHSEAKSVLFEHIKDQVILGPPNHYGDISLPLSRNLIVAPRNSSLNVDVCLYVLCGSGGTCIANCSVIFPARTRCNGFAEEAIIHGSNGKVKLKVVWVENEEKNGGNVEKNCEKPRGEDNNERNVEKDGEEQGVEKEEEDDGIEKQEGSVACEGSCQMETEDELYEDISNEKSSFRSLKVPRLNLQEDVSSRASKYSPTEPSDLEVQEDKAIIERSPPQRYKRSLLELFSVKFVEFEKLDASQIYMVLYC